ncbi:28S ribosomal protein S28, mitochondrial-like [Oppia nitens]|uniref:28S ribosomal protein S28, mitochondrial-like n=1 Tax=Oppia nitens TaxID=1686743 RepID=UPI0023DBB721|nr:28S ribosomal protein S28, mitochondrial-like [Oppia nitens]
MIRSVVVSGCLRQRRVSQLRTKCLTKNLLICRQLLSTSSSDDKSTEESVTNELLKNDMMKKKSSPQQSTTTANDDPIQSFAKAFEKFTQMSKESDKRRTNVTTTEPSEPFPTLLRYSPFIQMGDPEGKVVIGRIVDVVEDDLYIDFGGKFNGVCKRPKVNPNYYVREAKVKIRINDLEISDRFLGSTKDMTLLEADITLLGHVWSPAATMNQLKSDQLSGDII